MKTILFTILLALSLPAYSLTPYWVGFGSTTRNFSTAQKENSGGTTKFEFNPTLLVGVNLPIDFIASGFYFVPAIGYAKYSAIDNAFRNEILLQYHISQEILSSFFYLHYGLSNTITKIGGNGSSVSLNNGNGTTNFYAPSESKTSYIASLDIGGEMIFTTEFGAKLQVSIDRFLSSKRRRVSHMFTLNYYF